MQPTASRTRIRHWLTIGASVSFILACVTFCLWGDWVHRIQVLLCITCILAIQREIAVQRRGETLESRLAAGLLLLGAAMIAVDLAGAFRFGEALRGVAVGTFLLGGACSMALGLRYAVLPEVMRVAQRIIATAPYGLLLTIGLSAMNTPQTLPDRSWLSLDLMSFLEMPFRRFFSPNASAWENAISACAIVSLTGLIGFPIISSFYRWVHQSPGSLSVEEIREHFGVAAEDAPVELKSEFGNAAAAQTGLPPGARDRRPSSNSVVLWLAVLAQGIALGILLLILLLIYLDHSRF